jgi:hypothetical protein
VYVHDPEQFFHETGCAVEFGELYKMYPEIRPVDEEDFESRGLRYIELDEEPNYETHRWNPRQIKFENRNPMLRAVDKMLRRN